jgi:GDP-L-fucose synthase
MNEYDDKQFINVGSGVEHSIKQVAEIIKEKVGFKGAIEFNSTYPNGTPRKLMDVSKINNLGWKHQISFEKGIDMVLDILHTELQKNE